MTIQDIWLSSWMGRGKLNVAGKALINNTTSSNHFVLEY